MERRNAFPPQDYHFFFSGTFNSKMNGDFSQSPLFCEHQEVISPSFRNLGSISFFLLLHVSRYGIAHDRLPLLYQETLLLFSQDWAPWRSRCHNKPPPSSRCVLSQGRVQKKTCPPSSTPARSASKTRKWDSCPPITLPRSFSQAKTSNFP